MSHVKSPGRGRRVMAAATKNREIQAPRRLRFEQKSNFALLELIFRFGQMRNRVIDLFAGDFLTVLTFCTLPRYGVLVECKTDMDCFSAMEEDPVRHFTEAAFDAGTDSDRTQETAKAAVKVVCLAPKEKTKNALWFLQDRLRLHQCTTRDGRLFPRLLWQDEKLAVSHRRHSVHFWTEPYKSMM